MKILLSFVALTGVLFLVLWSPFVSTKGVVNTGSASVVPAAESHATAAVVGEPLRVPVFDTRASSPSPSVEQKAEIAPDRVRFEDLPLYIQGLVKEAAKAESLSLTRVMSEGVNRLAAENFQVAVDKMRGLHAVARKLHEDAIDKFKDECVASGKYEDYSHDEKKFLEALRKEDGLIRYPVEGESEGPHGSAQPYRYIVTITREQYSKIVDLRETGDYVDSFTQWRDALRVQARALILS